MTQKLFRFAYVCEFLLALVAIFTAWSEIGGQAALDLMHWGWKMGFGFALAACVVGFTTTIVNSEKIRGARAGGWLAVIVLLTIGMGVVTYYYTLEEQSGESDEPSGTVSISYPCMPTTGAYS
jgi:hypothetical protein